MRLGNWVAHVAGVTIVSLSVVSTAQAQYVTFSDINDAVPARFFNAASSAPDPANPNKLIIGFDTGFDYATWKYKDFRASTAAFSYTTAMDTISFKVDAPEGFYITKIMYSQQGTGYVIRTGKAAGAVNWVVNDYAADVAVFGTNPTVSASADLAKMYVSSVPVSITSSLFAFATPYLGSANVAVTGAEVVVELAPWPSTEDVVPTDPPLP